MSKPIHLSSECPAKLKRLYRRWHSAHKIAAQLDVNVSYVHAALTQGICPANPQIAKQLGFDGKHLRLGDERQKHIRWFKHQLSPQQRNKLIFDWYHYREEKDEGKG